MAAGMDIMAEAMIIMTSKFAKITIAAMAAKYARAAMVVIETMVATEAAVVATGPMVAMFGGPCLAGNLDARP